MKWVGFLNTVKLPGEDGKVYVFPKGQALHLPDEAFAELKRLAGEQVADLTPTAAADAIAQVFHAELFQAATTLVFIPCRQCDGLPAAQIAVTVCPACKGHGSLMRLRIPPPTENPFRAAVAPRKRP